MYADSRWFVDRLNQPIVSKLTYLCNFIARLFIFFSVANSNIETVESRLSFYDSKKHLCI